MKVLWWILAFFFFYALIDNYNCHNELDALREGDGDPPVSVFNP